MCRPAEWALKLDALVALAGKRVEERKKELLKKTAVGPQAQADVHRHIRLWSLRLQLYCRMRENFLNTGQWSGVILWHFWNHSTGHKLGLFLYSMKPLHHLWQNHSDQIFSPTPCLSFTDFLSGPSWPLESLPPAAFNSSKIQQTTLSSTFPNSPMPSTAFAGCQWHLVSNSKP